MGALEIQLRAVPSDAGARVAELTGVVDGSTAGQLDALVAPLQAEGATRLLLDFHHVRYVNSTGLTALVKVGDVLRAAGGGLALVRVTAKVKIYVDMLELQDALTICADEAEALTALGGTPGPPAAEPAAAVAATQPTSPTPPPAASQLAPVPPTPASNEAAALGAQSDDSSSNTTQAVMRATRASTFPSTIRCAGCMVDVELLAPGAWQCPRCEVLLNVANDGNVTFSTSGRAPAYELVLNGKSQAVVALQAFAAEVATGILDDADRTQLTTALACVAKAIVTTAYGGDPRGTYHVAIDAAGREVRVRVADHGQPFDASTVSTILAPVQASMNEFDCRANPSGGNVIQLVKRSG